MLVDLIKYTIISMRPKQWLVKNSFILAPMFFALRFSLKDIYRSVFVMLLFSLISGSIYLINDCLDRENDILHPKKKHRPVAAGLLKKGQAVTGSIVFLLFSNLVIYFVFPDILKFFLLYLGLNLLYSFKLKEVLILDILIIAAGFVIRVIIGGVVLDIELSPWILIITFLLSIFLGLIKRRQEIVRMNQEDNASNTRLTLKKYSIYLLDQLIAITTASTLIAYIIYVLDDKVRQRLSEDLFYTIPFVVFGIFRYLYLTYSENQGESPEEVVFSDYPFTINIVIWGIVFVLLISHA
jgi:4-hydroxybenzoate polyprenyltransferase